MFSLIDIHTHLRNDKANLTQVLNLGLEQIFDATDDSEKVFYSVGIHPWELDKKGKDWQEIMKGISTRAKDNKVKLIGECGMDKYISATIEKQIGIFEQHIALSEAIKKPLIIHCIGRFNELFALRKKHRPKQRWIIHGFRGKPTLAKAAIQLGFDISYGQYFNPQSIIETPLEHLFVESDATSIDIEEQYRKIAILKSCRIEDLKAPMMIFNC